MGDEVQAIKAGLLEVADIVVVNKGDRPGAQRTAAQLRAMLTVGAQHDRAAGDRPRPKRPEVLLATAMNGEGVPQLLGAIDRQRAAGSGADTANGATSAARLARAEAQLAGILSERVRDGLRDGRHRAETEAVLAAIAAHELDPYSGADRLLAVLGIR
jgi:LAO/AO transport system kinase